MVETPEHFSTTVGILGSGADLRSVRVVHALVRNDQALLVVVETCVLGMLATERCLERMRKPLPEP